MSNLRVLDLFCGAGGASAGYVRAGYEVVGVDIDPQPHYPFEFHQADALDVLKNEVRWGRNWTETAFDIIHASPPCQAYSTMTKRWNRANQHPDLVAETRELLSQLGMPYVIENVPGSPLIDPVTLCGEMFNLQSGEYRLRRHRLFESNMALRPLIHPTHTKLALSVYGHPGGSSKRDGLTFAQFSDWKTGMEIDWMNIKELSLAIPPAYTEWIGQQIRPLL